MTQSAFFPKGAGLRLAELASLSGSELAEGSDPDHVVDAVAALDQAGPRDLCFFDNLRHAGALAETRAGCVIAARRSLKLVPPGVSVMIAAKPYEAFAAAGQALFPAMLRPEAWHGAGVSERASVDPTARLEDGVTVEAFAVVAAGAAIGRGTVVGCGAMIGPGCQVGRDCRIGPTAVVQHALLGNGVILHPGVAIGQDGFGYAAGRAGIAKIVQVGRVIIQDDVEIGANTTIDRGSVRDTVIGEGTKIDNQVQIGHNVRVGRNCLIVAQVALAGSVTLGDGVMIGGQTCVNNDLKVGDGAQVAGTSAVATDIEPRARVGGVPARPVRDWLREMIRQRDGARPGQGAGGKHDG